MTCGSAGPVSSRCRQPLTTSECLCDVPCLIADLTAWHTCHLFKLFAHVSCSARCTRKAMQHAHVCRTDCHWKQACPCQDCLLTQHAAIIPVSCMKHVMAKLWESHTVLVVPKRHRDRSLICWFGETSRCVQDQLHGCKLKDRCVMTYRMTASRPSAVCAPSRGVL